MDRAHAIVVGGSIGGLCAAKALARHFDRVTIVDRDAFPDTPVDRAGVPQSRHVHALLARGVRVIDRFFPGVVSTMVARGANELDMFEDFAVMRDVGWHVRASSGVRLIVASRALVEFTVREHARRTPSIAFLPSTEVVGLSVTSAPERRVDGVLLRNRKGADSAAGSTGSLKADLVVDASGRSSSAEEWLRQIGAEVPDETTVDSRGAYSSRWYEAPSPERWPRAWWWKGISMEGDGEAHPFAGVLHPVDGGRWIVTVAGYGGNFPPSRTEDFDAALGRLRSPILADAVALAKPISGVFTNRSFVNRFRHYRRLKRPIAGFLASGDGVCAFNPFYGQGMTASALSAEVLEDALGTWKGALDGKFARAFFRTQAKALADSWTIATSADFLFPGTVGKPPAFLPAARAFSRLVTLGSLEDPVVLRRVAEVFNLLRSPESLASPFIVGRALAVAARHVARPGASTVSAMPPAPRL